MPMEPLKPTRFTKKAGVWNGTPVEFHEDRFNLAVKTQSTDDTEIEDLVNDVVSSLGVPAHVINRMGKRAAVEIDIPDPDVVDIVTTLKQQRPNDVDYAEPDFVIYATREPNDPQYHSPGQWGLDAIDAENGWEFEIGKDNVLIGIADSGIPLDDLSNLAHEDLQDAERIALGGFYIPVDEYYHGTHVTGIAAATTDSSKGIAGTNWASPVLITKVLDDEGTGYVGSVGPAVSSIIAAAQLNDPPRKVVINMSFKVDADSEDLRTACNLVEEYGGVICCGSGKTVQAAGAVLDDVDYPAKLATAYDCIIAVGATKVAGGTEVVARISLGPEVTVVAPGITILSTALESRWGTPYAEDSGTSMAAPFVTGLVSLMWSLDDALTNVEIKEILTETADDMLVEGETGVSYKRINAGEALCTVYKRVAPEIMRRMPCWVLRFYKRLTRAAGISWP